MSAVEAADPDTPVERLLELAGEFPSAFCANPILPLLHYEFPQLPAQFAPDVLGRLLRYDKIPFSFLQWVIACGDAYAVEAAKLHQGSTTTLPADDVLIERAVALRMETPTPDAEMIASIEMLLVSGILPTWLAEPLACIQPPQITPSQAYAAQLDEKLTAELAALQSDPVVLAEHPDVAVRLAAAQDPATPAATLTVLADDPNVQVQRALAANPTTPIVILDRCIADRSAYNRRARQALAANPSASAAQIEALVDDPEPAVRAQLLHRADLPNELRARLYTDALTICAETIHPLGATLCAAISSYPEALAEYAASWDWLTRYAIVQNRATPADVCALLIVDGIRPVQRAAQEELS